MKHIVPAVEKHRDLILNTERRIWSHPETGYKEYKTSAYLAEQFEKLGYTLTYAEGITGFYTVIDTKKEGPTLLILGELDSVICAAHPEADKETGAVHSCGHHAQCAALLGIAAALKEPHMLDGLSGKIKLCAVPAEELLEIQYRQELKCEGKISYMGGKVEFMSRGYFDDVDIAFMVHTSSSFAARDGGAVGCLAKNIIYKGKAAHAGGSPWNGCNALYAANCGINAANALRETFKEDDIIRFHPIITHGGDIVNGIPSTVRMESYVRGKTFEAIIDANKRINRALTGAALSLGANIEIIDIPGYAPMHNDHEMVNTMAKAVAAVLPEVEFKVSHSTGSGSTDMGDLSRVMPTIHPYAGGAKGTSHGSDYYIADPELACLGSAKMQLAMMRLLLENDAVLAKEIITNYEAPFPSIADYLTFIDSLNDSGDRITYHEDGTAEVRL